MSRFLFLVLTFNGTKILCFKSIALSLHLHLGWISHSHSASYTACSSYSLYKLTKGSTEALHVYPRYANLSSSANTAALVAVLRHNKISYSHLNPSPFCYSVEQKAACLNEAI